MSLLLLTIVATAWGAGNALELDGNLDYVELGALDPGTEFTVEAWLNIDGYGGAGKYTTIVEAVDTTNAYNSFFFGKVDAKWVVELEDVNEHESTSCSGDPIDVLCFIEFAPTNTNYHVAVSVTPSEINLYIDGVWKASETVSTSPGFGSDLWVIGGDTDTGSLFDEDETNGTLDEVRIWSTARTEEQINCTMPYQLTGTEPGLYSLYNMDDTGSVATDSAGSWDGTLMDSAYFVASPFGLTVSSGSDVLCFDYDGDGYGQDDGDCDDADASVYPGAAELCDGVDNDCDGSIDEGLTSTYFGDGDGDGYGDAGDTLSACAAPAGYVPDGTDCDDGDATAHPGAVEVCDGDDEDCDGLIDEGLLASFYGDGDGDGFGDSTDSLSDCLAPAGYVSDATDCDDGDASIYPGADEHCDGIDEDCDGVADNDAVDAGTYYADDDGDSYGAAGDTVDACSAPGGYVTDATDCDDGDAGIHPGAVEHCDGVDEDCDGVVDNGAVDSATWYDDSDGDGYGDLGAPIDACDRPSGTVSDATDCDDSDATVHPGAAEVPYDGIDQDCADGDLLDVDLDGFDGTGGGGDDCDDTDPDVFPGQLEIADGIDQDCDGIVDETTDWYDDDGDGYTEDGGDCDDGESLARPGEVEVADGIDNDCDGVIDNDTNAYDDDGDGFSEDDGDCHDGNPDMFPTNTEIDGNGLDDDCDGRVDGGVYDPDLDGITEDGGDCGPDDPSTYPGAMEVADGVDNDCDGEIDEGTEWYDDDSDHFTEAEGDCDDTDDSVSPDSPELEDGVDNDCDGLVDEGTDQFDDDLDGFTEEGGDCDDADASVHPGADELADEVDNDCDGVVDDGVGDDDLDGWTVAEGDCDDADPWANPELDEVCGDGVDNDCDTQVDEDCPLADGEVAGGSKDGCACSTGRAPALWWLVLVGLVVRRRADDR